MIILVCILAAAFITMTYLFAHEHEKRGQRTTLHLNEVPVFTDDATCVYCHREVGQHPVQVHMRIPLLLNKELPVTVEICQECVEIA